MIKYSIEVGDAMAILKKVEIDIHGMMELEAQKLLEREVIRLHKLGYDCICVIHGYKEGTVLKNMVLKKLRSNLIIKREQDFWNKGHTFLMLKK